jgi:uncharacterized protein
VQRSHMVRVPALVAIAALSLSSAPFAASFDCKKSSTPVEKLICSDTYLSELDEHLARYYAQVRDQVQSGAAGTCVGANQRQWLNSVRNVCKDAACLEQAYLARLAEFDGMQDGASTVKNIELPRADALAWVMGPEEDQVAAPRTPKAPALVVRGKLVNEVKDGDGYVVKANDGKKYLLLPLMFLGGPTTTILEGLSTDKDSTFEVRGQGETDGDGSVHFSQGACRFIYRLAR